MSNKVDLRPQLITSSTVAAIVVSLHDTIYHASQRCKVPKTTLEFFQQFPNHCYTTIRCEYINGRYHLIQPQFHAERIVRSYDLTCPKRDQHRHIVDEQHTLPQLETIENLINQYHAHVTSVNADVDPNITKQPLMIVAILHDEEESSISAHAQQGHNSQLSGHSKSGGSPVSLQKSNMSTVSAASSASASPRIKPTIDRQQAHFHKGSVDEDHELKYEPSPSPCVTALPSVIAYIQPIPPQASPMKVAVYGRGPRPNAYIKHTTWARDRQALEAVKPQLGVDEIIMHDGHGKLYEGLVSNIGVITKDNTVITADDDVLLGCTRSLLLQAAEELGLKIRLEQPDLRDIDQWQCAFICNSLRACTPVSHIIYDQRIVTKHPDNTNSANQQQKQQFNTEDDVKMSEAEHRTHNPAHNDNTPPAPTTHQLATDVPLLKQLYERVVALQHASILPHTEESKSQSEAKSQRD